MGKQKMTYSNKFLEAVEKVLKREGGYVNHPDDKGGETNFGISKRAHPDVDVKNLTREQAIEIYHREYWQKSYSWLQQLDVDTAILLFDFAVNMSPKSLAKCIQHALNACTHRVTIDGIVGSQTLNAIKVIHHQQFSAAFRATVAGHYRRLVVKDPSQEVFLAGWLNRAYGA